MVFALGSLFQHPDLQQQQQQQQQQQLLQLQQQYLHSLPHSWFDIEAQNQLYSQLQLQHYQQQQQLHQQLQQQQLHQQLQQQQPQPQIQQTTQNIQSQQQPPKLQRVDMAPNSPISRSSSPSPSHEENEILKARLINFMNNCTSNWEPGCSISRFQLFNEAIGCVLWEGKFFITGTDIVKYVSWRFKLEGELVFDQKKFEEGIFSDLRNLKPGQGAVLEEPRSKFLDFLFKLNCIRTHKKQKVFFWNSVPHEKLFQEALRRERKREINPIVDTLLSLGAPQSPPAAGSKRKRVVDTTTGNNSVHHDDYYHSDSPEAEEVQSRKKRSPILSISALIHPQQPEEFYQTPKTYRLHQKSHLNVLTPPHSESDRYSLPEADENNSNPSSPSSVNSSETQYYSDDDQDQEQEQYYPKSTKLSDIGLRCPFPGCGRQFRKKLHLDRHFGIHKNQNEQ